VDAQLVQADQRSPKCAICSVPLQSKHSSAAA